MSLQKPKHEAEDEDWNSTATEPSFNLFRYAKPEEEALKSGFVDPTVYQRWSRYERKLYQRLKTESIARQVEEEQIISLEDATRALDTLSLCQEMDDSRGKMDDLIGHLERLKLRFQKKEFSAIKKE